MRRRKDNGVEATFEEKPQVQKNPTKNSRTDRRLYLTHLCGAPRMEKANCLLRNGQADTRVLRSDRECCAVPWGVSNMRQKNPPGPVCLATVSFRNRIIKAFSGRCN